MQGRFAIKLINLDKLGDPDFDDFGKDDFVDFRDYLPKPRNALSDIQNLAIEISGKIPVKHEQFFFFFFSANETSYIA
ncbi:hypothetical protein RHMOL_Rhmol08G0143000 [Rhododendron molle]|uniref:Uncharacterized protein n=1 Tax=Rhododendron molle TaxID=49168 RepID=A0ACC0MNP0_RHOML|nr:hypothetical protein RHMOL_Rhmol08G0143000 [Rhododendron molle]